TCGSRQPTVCVVPVRCGRRITSRIWLPMGVLVMAPQRETWNRLNLLLDEVVEALDAACIPVSSQSIEPGPPSWSNCCDDGHAYIRIVRMHMVDPFPSQSRNPTHCRNIGALVEVGVL